MRKYVLLLRFQPSPPVICQQKRVDQRVIADNVCRHNKGHAKRLQDLRRTPPECRSQGLEVFRQSAGNME